MSADSLLRRLAKKALHPLLTEKNYQRIQASTKAWDIWRGTWSEPELELLSAALRLGETALDIGANFGLYAYHLSRTVGPSGRVYAFEPVPFTAATLRQVCSLLRLSNVEVFEKGCGREAGSLQFSVPVQASGAISAGLAHMGSRNDRREGKEQHARYEQYQQVQCEVVRLDDMFPMISNVGLIKCDIEGAELWALQGAEKLIDRCHPTVICEINPWFLEGFGISLDALLDFFFSKGYALYRYDLTSRKLRETAREAVVEDNYLFVHPDRRARLIEHIAMS